MGQGFGGGGGGLGGVFGGDGGLEAGEVSSEDDLLGPACVVSVDVSVALSYFAVQSLAH